ncbi:MAG: diacylglycerol kinase family lipid kinase [Bacillota bacterium]|jgi:diacylglycerol kinase (ATP)|nr:diacylglycerol kinase family lipid kinase [Bacillota bacterium]NLM07683.1 diacylglycerol kinase family lipid kinase [Clostridiales Family XIII bacterium]
MKHIFILNPVAGHQDAESKFLPRILEAVKAEDVDYEIHRTMNIGDGENYVRNRCIAFPDEKLRFYAVGGDGTLNEVANGVFGFPNAEIAFIPAGTGNDFARNFAHPKAFLDIKSQIRGRSKKIDLIQYGDRIIVNMLNIGLDCEVVTKMEAIKEKTFLRGPLAYITGVAVVFAGNEGYNLKVTLEDRRVFDREFTLVAVGNGAFCGGGFKGVPKAKVDDGLLDVSLINKVNRRTFASFISKYYKGTHLDTLVARDIVTYVQCRSLTVEPKGTMKICVDGEVFTSGKLNISVLPASMDFSIPDIL